MASRTVQSLATPLLRIAIPRVARPTPIRLLHNPVLLRAAHSIPRPPRKVSETSPATQTKDASGDQNTPATPKRPFLDNAYYQLSFTCKPCSNRSQHSISKQGYHKGSILITCPSCRNRHVISDHLNIFGDRKVTIEDIMREQGQLVKRGSLGEDGDIEFWPEEKYAEEAAKIEMGGKSSA